MIFKNSVPIGYFEGLSIFERMESGFNLYYTFRDGETAWLYARTLNVMRHLLGVTVFSLDPYQLGDQNEEGIQSGAFWFYRKLGFCSTSQSLRELTKKEEAKIRSREKYRTAASTLRKLAKAPMILDVDESRSGIWDVFQIRNVTMRAQRELQRKFAGEVDTTRKDAVSAIRNALRVSKSVPERHLKTLSDFAVLLLSINDEINEWDEVDKRKLWEIIKAKSGEDETRYLNLMQKHPKLRAAFIKLGSLTTS